MFKKELATKILKLIDEKEMTLETLSEVSHLSRKFIGNIIYQRQSPTLDSFEKLCAALEVTPNDLLVNEKSLQQDKAALHKVTQIFYSSEHLAQFPICPSCNRILEKEYQAYCDYCGAHLSWTEYNEAEIIYTIEYRRGKLPCLK